MCGTNDYEPHELTSGGDADAAQNYVAILHAEKQ